MYVWLNTIQLIKQAWMFALFLFNLLGKNQGFKRVSYDEWYSTTSAFHFKAMKLKKQFWQSSDIYIQLAYSS